MRINEGFASGARIDARHEAPVTNQAQGVGNTPASQSDGRSSAANQTGLAELVARVDETPEVRSERIESVSRRLSAGFYETRAAAEQTAVAILHELA